MAPPALALWIQASLGAFILDGTPADVCAYPSAVLVRVDVSACSGTLIHPRVVALERSCPDFLPTSPTISFRFGEFTEVPNSSGPIVDVPRDQCTFNDVWGVCVLPEAVEFPIAPIAIGCERALAHRGAELTLVGNGTPVEGGFSVVKRIGTGTVSAVGDGIFVVEGEQLPCTGDGGSPAFVRLSDGSVRTVGIARTGSCRSLATYVDLAEHVDWIEEVTGFDVTPCHDAEGFPEPGPDCHDLYSGPTGDEGTWDELCIGAAAIPNPSVCPGDVTPPSVQIVQPESDVGFDDESATVDIVLDATDLGYGVRDVRLEIGGELLDAEDLDPPYQFELELPLGDWQIRGAARDWAGNVALSDTLVVHVGPVDPGPGVDETGTTTGERGSDDESPVDPGTDDTTTATTGAEPSAEAEDGSPKGCACDVADRDAGWLSLAWLGMLGLGRRRRRRAVDACRT